jgi:DNA mismatch endonuclease (patch repair protein)
MECCFWHGCPKHETKPRNNVAFWRNKFALDKSRDQLVTRTLRQSGWRALRIREHELARKREGHLVEGPAPGRRGERGVHAV